MRQGNVPPRRDQHGFTLVEVMVAALVLMVGVLGTLVMIDGANKVQRDNNARTSASGLARDILEQARAIEYQLVAQSGTTTTTLVNKLREKSSLTGTVNAAGAWIVNRRGVDFTIKTKACTFDDPSDSLGSPAPVNACPAGAGALAGTDSNPDDFRRVIVTISWKENGTVKELVHTTQIVNPGGGLGPRITAFPNPNSGAQIGDHAGAGTGPSSVSISATSTPASVVRWSIDDGRSSGEAAMTVTGGTSWSWTWDIGTVDIGTPGVNWALDGSYAVNAQAFDSRGVPGELRVANVILNRRQALAPKEIGAGRSGGGSGSSNWVEMDWVANPERDVIGYRVHRLNADNSRTRICPAPSVVSGDQVTTSLSCTDANPPGESAMPTIKYELVAVDRPTLGATSGTTEGDVKTLTVGTLGPRLDRPLNLTATTVNGRPRLSWTAPSVNTAATPPEKILFYRIYRDGVRYANTVSDATTFTDNTPSATSHRYMVSAVEGRYNEGKLSDERVWP